MKINYHFENNQGILLMIFEDNPDIDGSSDTLTLWLHSDIRLHESTLETIDKVISGELSNELLWGNGFKAYVEQDFTDIHFNYEEDDPSVKPCKLPTKMLREIVAIWLEEYKKFHSR